MIFKAPPAGFQTPKARVVENLFEQGGQHVVETGGPVPLIGLGWGNRLWSGSRPVHHGQDVVHLTAGVR